jgi:hypothetical protein
MQQDANQLDVIRHNQNNGQNVTEFLIRQQVLLDDAPEYTSLRELLYLESEPCGKVTALISDTVTPMRYREVIRAPLWLLALVYFFMLSLVISIWAALGNIAALIALVVVTAALVWIYISTALTIEVDDKELRVGTAHINLEFIDECVDLDNKAIRLVRTRDANPNAFLAIRFWAPAGIRATITDKNDSTPYWLISSNRGDELIKAIKN